jgi:hypothetical protein
MSTHSLPDAALLKPEMRPYKQSIDDLLLAMASMDAQALCDSQELLDGEPGDLWAVVLRHIQRHLLRATSPSTCVAVKPSTQESADAAFAKSYSSYARPLLKGQVASEWEGGTSGLFLQTYLRYLPQDKKGSNVPTRPPYSYGGTAEDRMAPAMVTLTLAQLVQLTSNPHFMPLME